MKKICYGIGKERIPDIGFSLMALTFKFRDWISPRDKILAPFGIRKGFTVIDYGCGPGGYVKPASDLVGETGKVYAVDVHKKAIASVRKRIEQDLLTNVEPVLAQGYSCPISAQVSDVIFALDMFHHIDNPTAFLKELHRLIKPTGYLIIDDGHQPREQTKRKIIDSQCWKIENEDKNFLKCTPTS